MMHTTYVAYSGRTTWGGPRTCRQRLVAHAELQTPRLPLPAWPGRLLSNLIHRRPNPVTRGVEPQKKTYVTVVEPARTGGNNGSLAAGPAYRCCGEDEDVILGVC